MSRPTTQLKSVAAQEKLEDVTTCCICDEIYSDPKILPCVHTFCMTCLQRTGTQNKKGPGDSIPCPLCRQEFKVPQEGFTALQTNFFMVRLIEIAANRDRASSACDKHKHENLCLYCSDCNEVLCLVCLRESHQNHRLSDLGSAAKILRSQLQGDLSTANRCKSNALKKKEKITQSKCAIVEKVEGFEREVCQAREDLKVLIDRHAESLLTKLSLLKTKSIKEIEIEEKEIDEHLASLERLEKCCAELTSVDQHDGLICKMASEVKQLIVDLEVRNKTVVERQLRSSEIYFTRTVSKSLEEYRKNDTGNIIGEVKEINYCDSSLNQEFLVEQTSTNRADKSMNTGHRHSLQTSTVAGSIQQKHFVDIKSASYSNLPELSTVGLTHTGSSLLNTDKSMIKNDATSALIPERSGPVLVRTIQTKECRGITGFTILKEKMYVISKESPEVEVFDSINFEIICRWKLYGLETPTDLTSCSKINCLYIMDAKYIGQSSKIIKVGLNGKLLHGWLVQDNCGCMSVTQESNIIVAVYEKHRICEYSPDGILLYQLHVPSNGSIHPLHAIKLADCRFLVSCGSVSDSHHRICVIHEDSNTGEGVVAMSFGGLKGHSRDQVNVPVFLALSSVGDVLVADWENHRVLLLSSSLQLKTQLLTNVDGLRRPFRLCISDAGDRLIVSDNDSYVDDGRILVYESTNETVY